MGIKPSGYRGAGTNSSSSHKSSGNPYPNQLGNAYTAAWSGAISTDKGKPRILACAYTSDQAKELANVINVKPELPSLSPQQAAVLKRIHEPGNFIISARAGTGKTTLLRLCVAEVNGSASASTIHSAGYRAWIKAHPTVRLDEDKVSTLLASFMESRHCDLERRNLIFRIGRYTISRLVGLAKLNGVGLTNGLPDEPATYLSLMDEFGLSMTKADVLDGNGRLTREAEFLTEMARLLLEKSIEISDSSIDFNDQLYMPLQAELGDHFFDQYDMVFVDEAQDLSNVRLALIGRTLKGDGKLVAVGDPYQAIYAFSGALCNSLDNIRDSYSCDVMPLTVTYRCPKQVVTLAKQWVADYEAAPTAPDGSISTLTEAEFNPLTLKSGDAVLCRNKAPLLSLAFRLIANNKGCRIEGKDIQRSITSLFDRYPDLVNVPAMTSKLQEYFVKETARLDKLGRESSLLELKEKEEMVFTVLSNAQEKGHHKIADVKGFLNGLFVDTKEGTSVALPILSTVHKSKGREWKKVVLLGRNKLMPSQHALSTGKPEFIQQEFNLCYVGVTRAMSELVEVQMDMGDADKGQGKGKGKGKGRGKGKGKVAGNSGRGKNMTPPSYEDVW